MDEKKAVSMPASPTAAKSSGDGAGWQPHQVDPELAALHLAETMMDKMGTPGIVSKEFVVWQGLLRGMNHRDDNPTYFDCSLLLSVFDAVFKNSVNINGSLFEKFWQFMMKPKMIVQGIMGQNTFDGEQKQSIWEKYAPSWLGGKGGENADANKPK